MTKYSIDIYNQEQSCESIALMADTVPFETMVQFCRSVAVDPSMNVNGVIIVDIETGEILYELEEHDSDDWDEPDGWDDEIGFNPYEGCYDYDC